MNQPDRSIVSRMLTIDRRFIFVLIALDSIAQPRQPPDRDFSRSEKCL